MWKTGDSRGFALGDMVMPMAVLGLLLCAGGYAYNRHCENVLTPSRQQARELLSELAAREIKDFEPAEAPCPEPEAAATASAEFAVAAATPVEDEAVRTVRRAEPAKAPAPAGPARKAARRKAPASTGTGSFDGRSVKISHRSIQAISDRHQRRLEKLMDDMS